MKKLLIIVSLVMLAVTQVGAVGIGVPGHYIWFSYEEFWAVKDNTGKYLDEYIKTGMTLGDVGLNKVLRKETPDLLDAMTAKGLYTYSYYVGRIIDKVGDRSKRKWSSEWVWGFEVDYSPPRVP